jgi:hypothetical protein
VALEEVALEEADQVEEVGLVEEADQDPVEELALVEETDQGPVEEADLEEGPQVAQVVLL